MAPVITTTGMRMRRLSALTATIRIIPTLARRTAIMGRIGSTEASSLEPDRGSTVFAEAIGAAEDSMDGGATAVTDAAVITVGLVHTDVVGLTGAHMLGADLATPDAGDMPAAGPWHEAPWAVGSAEALAGTLAAAVSTAVEVSTVVEAMAAGDAGN